MRNLIIAATLLCMSTAAFADQAPRPMELVHQTVRADPSKFIWKQMQNLQNWNVPRFSVVFVQNGRRYTIQNDWLLGGILVYERPDGTGGDRSLITYRDWNSDGIVDYGTSATRHYTSPDDPVMQPSPGGEHNRPYYQQHYTESLLALQATLGE